MNRGVECYRGKKRRVMQWEERMGRGWGEGREGGERMERRIEDGEDAAREERMGRGWSVTKTEEGMNRSNEGVEKMKTRLTKEWRNEKRRNEGVEK